MANWTNLEWDVKPTACPECKTTLRSSQYSEDGAFCPRFHGKLSSYKKEGAKVYGWYSLDKDE